MAKKKLEITFDFSNAGRKWRNAWIVKAGDMDENRGDFVKMLEVEDELLEMAILVVKDVPRAMLIDDAPDDIDWTDSASFEYVRADVNLTLEVSTALHGTTKN